MAWIRARGRLVAALRVGCMVAGICDRGEPMLCCLEDEVEGVVFEDKETMYARRTAFMGDKVLVVEGPGKALAAGIEALAKLPISRIKELLGENAVADTSGIYVEGEPLATVNRDGSVTLRVKPGYLELVCYA